MIVAGMTQPAMISAAAGYAAVRSDFGVNHKQERVGLAKILLRRPCICINPGASGLYRKAGSKTKKGASPNQGLPLFLFIKSSFYLCGNHGWNKKGKGSFFHIFSFDLFEGTFHCGPNLFQINWLHCLIEDPRPTEALHLSDRLL